MYFLKIAPLAILLAGHCTSTMLQLAKLANNLKKQPKTISRKPGNSWNWIENVHYSYLDYIISFNVSFNWRGKWTAALNGMLVKLASHCVCGTSMEGWQMG